MFRTMIALSARQPWAELLVKGRKGREIRTWAPPDKHIGKRILIHASLGKSNTPDEVIRMIAPYNMYRGAIIGSAELSGYRIYKTYSDWVIDQINHLNALDWYKEGMVGFTFEEPYEFPTPIPLAGKLNFFEVEPNDLKLSWDQNRTLTLGL